MTLFSLILLTKSRGDHKILGITTGTLFLAIFSPVDAPQPVTTTIFPSNLESIALNGSVTGVSMSAKE